MASATYTADTQMIISGFFEFGHTITEAVIVSSQQRDMYVSFLVKQSATINIDRLTAVEVWFLY